MSRWPPRGVTAESGGVSRRSVLATTIALTAVSAGCTDSLERATDGVDGPLIDQIPADSELLAHVRVTDLEDDNIAQVFTALEATESERLDVEAAITSFGERTGLDPLEAEELLLFELVDSNGVPTDVVVAAEWSETDVVDSLEDASGLAYEEAEYADRPIYEPDNDADSDQEPATLGVHDDGRYVIGDDHAVRASLAAQTDGNSPEGSLREAYDGARSMPVVTALVPADSLAPAVFDVVEPPGATETLESIQAVGADFDLLEDNVDLLLSLYLDSAEEASDLEELLGAMVALLAETDDEHGEELTAATVESDETRVDLEYNGDPEPIFALLDEV